MPIKKTAVFNAEAEARILVDWLDKKKYFYHDREEELSVQGGLLELLPRIHDGTLRQNIAETLKKSVKQPGT